MAVAETVRESVLGAIAQLRLEISAGRLPLVIWRIHDQMQAISEGLRGGVLRS